VRTVERNFRVPIAGHVDLDFGAILAGRFRALDSSAGVHHHSRHIHVEVELYVPDIDQLTLRVSEFDHDFVVASPKLALRMNEIHR
jgi:hypothetical protein